MNVEHFRSMDGYTFDEGVAFLVLVRAPFGVINYLKSTHNRSHLHSEIHKQLRMPGTLRLLKEKGFGLEENRGSFPQIPQNSPNMGTVTNLTENVPETTKTGTDSNDNVPKNDKSGTNEAEDETDPTEIVLIKEDVRTHENTRLEDMPNDLCRTLWQKRQDVWRELQQAHLKMRSVPEGEEHNEERAYWRAEVIRLDGENDNYWKQIDAEIERFKEEKERADKKANKTPDFDISTYRAYVSKALRKKQLTPAQLAELQHRVDAMIAANVELKPETLDKLKAIGITVG